MSKTGKQKMKLNLSEKLRKNSALLRYVVHVSYIFLIKFFDGKF